MKSFVVKLFTFLIVNLVIASLLVSLALVADKFYQPKNWETESNLFIIPQGQKFDLAILGTSHGRMFARAGNHPRLESILDKKIINMSMGGGGIVPANIYLEYFFSKDNQTDTILYFIDPWIFYSAKWNEENRFVVSEPLDYTFTKLLLKYDVQPSVLSLYWQEKFRPGWYIKKPVSKDKEEIALDSVDNQTVKDRLDYLYQDGTDEQVFASYMKYLEKLVSLAKGKQVKVVFVTTPSLLGAPPKLDELQAAIKKLQADYDNIQGFYDASNYLLDPKYYYNHDHLNTDGVVTFTQNFLSPILK